ncbi:hypothetical protein As57867_004903, partial [Aphanomyces stellatus]
MSVPDDAHIKRMGISNKKLDWHPDNMTLAQIVQVIQDYNATTPPTQEDQLTDILEVSKHLDEDFRTPIDHTKADDLWQWVSRSPLHANVKLTTLLHEGQPALDRIIRLHAWHRWTVASLVPQTTTFLRGFQHAFGVKPTWDFMSALSATPDFTQYEGALPDATVLDIEDALAAFELWFAMQVDTLFRSDEWVVFLTKRPVMWLPASKAPRMLSADTIFNLIHSTFGTHFVAAMAALWPCRWVNTLHQIQQMNFRYSGQGTMLFSDSPQLRLGSPTHILTANINGLKENGHRLVANRLHRHTVCALQETKLALRFQLNTFRFHLDHNLGRDAYYLAINDHRQDAITSESHRSSGLIMLFTKDTPGFNNLHHDVALDVPDRYMVVRTSWGPTPVFFHNIYAPIANHERETFFASLPTVFPPNSHHIVMGDFNLPLDRMIDSLDPLSSHHTGREECMAWLNTLGVIDAWRIHHPHDRIYSSPKGKNRLDYVLLDDSLIRTAYKDAIYFRSSEVTEHLCHSVTLQATPHESQRGYWQLPKELLSIREVAETIVSEAKALLSILRTANNPGVVWSGWKKRTHKFLTAYHVRHHAERKCIVIRAEREWRHAQANARHGRIAASELLAARAAFDEALADWKAYENDVNFDFHASNNETSKSHFFRSPQKSLYKVPIVEVVDV